MNTIEFNGKKFNYLAIVNGCVKAIKTKIDLDDSLVKHANKNIKYDGAPPIINGPVIAYLFEGRPLIMAGMDTYLAACEKNGGVKGAQIDVLLYNKHSMGSFEIKEETRYEPIQRELSGGYSPSRPQYLGGERQYRGEGSRPQQRDDREYQNKWSR